MIRQIEDKNLFQKTKLFIQEIGFKTASAYALLVILLVAITVTFISVQKRQNLRQNAAGSTLTVDATKSIRPFTHLMLGQALVNWEHSWGKPFPNEVPGLSATMKTEGVGIIRYAGGLWANYVGFDRTLQRTPYTNWTKNGNTYSFTYGTDELDSLNKFADNIGADVMIQVDIAQNDPTMWADMVKYVNIEKGYNFKYWEFGNEFDVDTALNITPEIYAARTSAYIEAMKDVDPSIHIVSGVPGTAADAPRQGWNDSITDLSHYMTLTAPIVTPKGRKIDELSYHWYQACNSTSVTDLLQYQFSGLATTSWRNSYSRIWSQIAPSRVNTEIIGANPFKQGITELNFDACNYDNTTNGNHLNALWVSDILGRLSYNGLDFVTWYEGYGTQGYSQIYPDDANIDWWLEHQINMMDDSSKNLIKEIKQARDMLQFHHGTGMAIRNYYGLWHENGLTRYFNNTYDVHHADDMSSILLEALWHKIHGKEYNPHTTVERFREHWTRMGCNMKGEKNATS
jgi:hypothetical protein